MFYMYLNYEPHDMNIFQRGLCMIINWITCPIVYVYSHAIPPQLLSYHFSTFTGFNIHVAYVLEGAKLIIVETWGGGHIWQGRRGISDGVICLGGGTEILGGHLQITDTNQGENLETKLQCHLKTYLDIAVHVHTHTCRIYCTVPCRALLQSKSHDRSCDVQRVCCSLETTTVVYLLYKVDLVMFSLQVPRHLPLSAI